MKLRTTTAIALAAGLLAAGLLTSGAAFAQQAAAPAAAPVAPPDLNAIPDKMPFNVPFGTPITLDRAQAVVQAAVAEANKRGWPEIFSVVDNSGNLVAFGRMDGAQLGSIAVSEHKARTSVKFRRPTKAFEEAIQKNDLRVLTIDDVMGARGGIPLIEDGKLIGAIGCSGAAGSQDEVACTAGAATISK